MSYSPSMLQRVQIIFLRRYVCLLALLLVPVVVVTARAATENATVSVDIMSMLSLVNQSDLTFGEITVGDASGTVVLSPAGSRLSTGGVFVNYAMSAGPAVFDISGLPNAVYAITLPDSVVLTGASGNSMVVDDFTSLPENNGLTGPGGQQNLFVGATLNVNTHQAVGSYSGLMSITVEYN